MRKILAAALLCAATLPAYAADKSGPKPYAAPAGTVLEDAGHWTGFYLEGSAAAANFKIEGLGSDSFQSVGMAVGYDRQIGTRLVVGARLGYDYARGGDANMLHVGVRAGYLANPSLLVYVPLTYTMDGSNPKFDDGIVSIGLGFETHVITTKFSIFAEATKDVVFSGASKVLDEATTFRAGARFRF